MFAKTVTDIKASLSLCCLNDCQLVGKYSLDKIPSVVLLNFPFLTSKLQSFCHHTHSAACIAVVSCHCMIRHTTHTVCTSDKHSLLKQIHLHTVQHPIINQKVKLLILILRLFWSEDLTRLRLTSPHGWWHRAFQAFLEQMLLRKQIKMCCHMLQLVLSKNRLKRKTLWFKFIFFQVMIPQQHFHSVSWYWFDKHKVALVLFTCNYTRKWTFNASTIFASHFSFVLLVLKMSCWHISASVWEKLKKKFFFFFRYSNDGQFDPGHV